MKPPPPHRPQPPSKAVAAASKAAAAAKAAAAITRRARLVKAAIDVSLQKPIDPLKLIGALDINIVTKGMFLELMLLCKKIILKENV